MQPNPNEKPIPLKPPQVDSQFLHHNPLYQILETLRYTALSIEYALSPNRTLRIILYRCVNYWLMAFIPALLFLPLLHFTFNQLNSIVMLLSESVTHLILPVSFIAVFVLLLLFILRR